MEYCTMWMLHLVNTEWLSELHTDVLFELLEWLFATKKGETLIRGREGGVIGGTEVHIFDPEDYFKI